MTLRVQNVTIDCIDPLRIANFWAEVLGWRITNQDGGEIDLEPPAGSREEGIVPDLVFLSVSDPRVVKNRLHLDLRPMDQDAEVSRLMELGATKVDVGQSPESTWVVMTDPEGNEFCVLRAFNEEELATMDEI